MNDILSAIYTYIQTGSTFMSSIGNRFYHATAPNDVAYPYCTYININDQQGYSAFQRTKGHYIFQFTVWDDSENAENIIDISDKLKDLLDYSQTGIVIPNFATFRMDRLYLSNTGPIYDAERQLWAYPIRYTLEVWGEIPPVDNLVLNGDFSQGTPGSLPTYWKCPAGGFTLVNSRGQFNDINDNPLSVNQRIDNIKSDWQYLVSYDFFDIVDIRMALQERDAGLGFIRYPITNFIEGTGSNYFRITTTSTTAYFYFEFSGTDLTNSGSVDNIFIVER